MVEPVQRAALFAWIHARIQRHLQVHGHRLLQASGALGDLYVSPAEARATLSRPIGVPLGLPEAPPMTPPPDGLLSALYDRLGLSPGDACLLLAAAAPALDVDIARLYTFAWADFSQKLPDVGFLTELTDQPRTRFAAQAPLVQRHLVRLVAPKRWGPDGPRLHRGVVAHEAVVDWIDGSDALPALVAKAAEWQAPHAATLVLPDADHARLTAAIDGALVPGGRLMIAGRTGSGRRSLVRAMEPARRLLHVTVDRLPADQLDAALAAIDVAACLHHGVVALRIPSTLEAPLRRALIDALAIARAPHLLLVGRAQTIAGLDLPRVTLPDPDGVAQQRIWTLALQAAQCPPDLADLGAARFDLTPGAIFAAARSLARAEAPTAQALSAAVDGQIRHALGSLADPVHTRLTWDDVVLPDEIMAVLTEIQSQATHRAQVFDAWGFRRKLSYGRGLSCLFAGPPGTGKTMAAGIMAATLGRPLYRVDLSRVVSKWVGETEKNLARVFDEAERAQVILFFDEADSLFAKRTQVQGAQDRFANLEVNYLLQRMEQFDGMSILTTNFERGLDEAFKRRLRFRVYFPMPDAEQRAELWRRMTPAALPITADVRWEELARKFKFSGGNIKNVVLRAAFLAAAEDGIVTEALLHKAASAEKREMGRL